MNGKQRRQANPRWVACSRLREHAFRHSGIPARRDAAWPWHPRFADTHRTRQAVTLIEVLLVLVILALVAATAWPSLERSLADQRLRDAADMVRAEWANTKKKAMSSGIAYQFCYTPEEQTYWVEPCEEVETVEGPSSTTQGKSRPAAQREPDKHQLPDEITFVRGRVARQSPESASADQPSATQDAQPLAFEGGELNAPIVFFPDGTCLSGELILRNEHERGITVTIRGITAIDVVGEIFNVEEGLP